MKHPIGYRHSARPSCVVTVAASTTWHTEPAATATPTDLDIKAIIRDMRARGREDLVHYAGAAHRDPMAHQMCLEYLDDPTCPEGSVSTEHTLKHRAWRKLHPAT